MDKKRSKICVVDDDPSVCKALKRLIASAGFEVFTYVSPYEFLSQFHVGRPDLLVLDMRMPGMNGLELQKQLAASDSNIPIIFITAHEENGTRALAMERGAVAFLNKPFDEAVLLDAITDGLEQKSPQFP